MNVWAAWIYRKPIFDFLGAKLTVSCKNHLLTKKTVIKKFITVKVATSLHFGFIHMY